jgi:exonuclease SbcC
MQIAKIELSGFRAFAGKQVIDLDADAVILVGPNGYGKTSLLDGILWSLSGRIPRLGGNDEHLVSIYSPSGEAHVALELRDATGRNLKVARSFDGAQQHLRLEVDNGVFREEEARFRLLKELWPDALATADSAAALASTITRSVYLQQDLVRQFVEADTEQDRFAAVSELVGAGRVTELQLQLDRAKTAWTRASNSRARDGEASRERLRSLESQLERISGSSQSHAWDLDDAWPVWWAKARELGVSVARPPEASSNEASQALDGAVKQFQVLRQATERRRTSATWLLADLKSHSLRAVPDEAPLRESLERARAQVGFARSELSQAQARAAETRRVQVEAREERAELRALAELALRHLGDRCPVCTQPYDEKVTRAHLEALLRGSSSKGEQESGILEEGGIGQAAAALERAEKEQATAELNLRQAQQAAADERLWLADIEGRLRELGLSVDAVGRTTALEALIKSLTTAAGALKAHQEQGEHLALGLAQAGDRARRAALELEIKTVRKEVAELDRFLAARERTGDLAARILDGLREAAADVVEFRLQHIEPLLQRIYARIDPHPAFKAIKFHSWFRHGRGHLATRIDDSVANVWTEEPARVLSSSQMNAVAAAVFLAFNIGVQALPLKTAVLDDPLQSLDDVNLLGLLDLLRRVKGRRQLLLSTHDVRFGRLLARKLRPVDDGQRTMVVEFNAWTREGPELRIHEIGKDQQRLRIVA